MGAMSAYGVALVSGSPWLGVLVAACVGLLLGALHAGICQLPRVNDIATGIGLMLFGTGLAFFLGKALHPAQGAQSRRDRSRLVEQHPAGPPGAAGQLPVRDRHRLAFALPGRCKNTRWGLIVRLAGESVDAALAIGASVDRVRLIATSIGGAFAGVGGRFPVALLPGQLERGPVERPGPDGSGAGHLRRAGTGALPVGVAAVRRRRCDQPGAAVGRHHSRANTCSAPRPMCLRWR
jgi:simple sugar transport system permease protein